MQILDYKNGILPTKESNKISTVFTASARPFIIGFNGDMSEAYPDLSISTHKNTNQI